MLAKVWNYLGLALTYLRFNFKTHLEYRAAFISQILAMILNDCVWVLFWTQFFERFPVMHGWGATEVITMWAIAAAGIGIADTLCGNAAQLAALIARGDLDAWLLYPRRLLPHIVLGKMNASAFGDTLFGYAIYIAFVHPDLQHFLLFSALTVSVAFLFIGFNILVGSLGFFLGNAQSLAEHLRFALVTFSTYPAGLFDGPIRFLLYTLIPAAFVSYLPIEALKEMSLGVAALSLAGSIALTAVAALVFNYGLKHYESGNLLIMKG